MTPELAARVTEQLCQRVAELEAALAQPPMPENVREAIRYIVEEHAQEYAYPGGIVEQHTNLIIAYLAQPAPAQPPNEVTYV